MYLLNWQTEFILKQACYCGNRKMLSKINQHHLLINLKDNLFILDRGIAVMEIVKNIEYQRLLLGSVYPKVRGIYFGQGLIE